MPPSEVSAGYRKRTRWDGYDYQSDGLYFVTICTHERKHLFGTVDGDIMVLNRLGLIVEEEWWLSGKIRREIVIDSFIIMPDHLHGIVEIAQPDENRDESTHGAGCDKRAHAVRPYIAHSSFARFVRRRIQVGNDEAHQQRACHTGCAGLAAQLLRPRCSRQRRPGENPALHGH